MKRNMPATKMPKALSIFAEIANLITSALESGNGRVVLEKDRAYFEEIGDTETLKAISEENEVIAAAEDKLVKYSDYQSDHAEARDKVILPEALERAAATCEREAVRLRAIAKKVRNDSKLRAFKKDQVPAGATSSRS